MSIVALALRAALVALLVLVPAASASAALRGTDLLPGVDGVHEAGDVDGDGVGDLVTRDRVLFGERNGAPAAGGRGFGLVTPPGGASPTTVTAAGDVDGDGFDDVAVGTDTTTFVVYGADSEADVTLAPGPRVTRIGGGKVLRAFDLDGDDRGDLIVTSAQTAAAWAIVRGGSRTAEIATDVAGPRVSLVGALRDCETTYVQIRFIVIINIPTGTSCREHVAPAILAPGDVDGDGRDDLFFPDNSDGNLRDLARGYGEVWRGRAVIPALLNPHDLGTDGVVRVDVGAASTYVNGPDFAHASPDTGPIGDVTGDGLADLVLEADPLAGRFFIYPGRRGDAAYGGAPADRLTVSTQLPPAVGPPPRRLTSVPDADGDGIRDLALWGPAGPRSNPGPANVQLRAGSATTGGETATITDSIPGLTGTISDERFAYGALRRVGDVDGDGREDLALQTVACEEPVAFLVTHHADRAAPRLRRPCDGATFQRISPATTNVGESAVRTVTLVDPATVTFETLKDGAVLETTERDLPAGETKVPWDGTVDGEPLGAGSYVLRLTPSDDAGNEGAPVELPFTVQGGPVGPLDGFDVTPRQYEPDRYEYTVRACEAGTVTYTLPAGWVRVAGPASPIGLVPAAGQCTFSTVKIERGASPSAGEIVFTTQAGQRMAFPLRAERDKVTLELVSQTADRVVVRAVSTGVRQVYNIVRVPPGWSVISPSVSPFVIVPQGGELLLTLQRGAVDGELVLDYDANLTFPAWAGTQRLALKGTASSSGTSFSSSAESVYLSAVFGRTARTTLTITNTGTSTAPVAPLAVTGAGFALEAGTCGPAATPVDLAPGASCTVTVALRPAWPTTSYRGELTVGTLTVPLGGRGRYF